ncbi:MAG TPA: pitrilysin family protein [Thermoanaerobaculia bacterium]|nr:pitrilysin family protein [Thermoanaerobaculia bacterium]
MSLRLSFALLGLLALAAAALVAAPAGQGSPAPGQPSRPAGGSKPASRAGAGGASSASSMAPAAAAAEAFPYQVAETTLANGLKVVAIPYDSPGTLAYLTLVRTGSRDEVESGHSGFAHFFEHMMFRGTDKYSQDRYNDVLKGMGADFNAFTTDDFTLYHVVGPASQLATIADMEADRFQNLKYSQDAFRTEALAILGEYNKNASSPILPLEEKLRDLAYSTHTYKHTTLGFLVDVKAMPGYYDYSRQFFARFYRPENCVVVVVGDVQPRQVFTVVEREYAGWKKGYSPAQIPPEPPQREAKGGHVDWPAPIQPILLAGWHIPAFSDRTVDSATLDVIAELLFAESAPLYQELVVDKQWVDLLQGSADSHRDPYLFSVIARVKSADLVPKVRQAIESAFAGLQAKPPDAGRLTRIASHLRNAFALRLSTPQQVATQVSAFLALSGDVQSINRQQAQYPRVTPADVQRLARSVFQPQNQTTVTLAGPEAKRPAGAGKPQGGADHAHRR